MIYYYKLRYGGTGRRVGLKSQWNLFLTGSNPVAVSYDNVFIVKYLILYLLYEQID